MQVSYQRDLYKVQLCCETKAAERKLGYPLQMCLRNPIEGLLPCHVQTLDDKVSVCWDITSANSIQNLFEDAAIDEKILRMMIRDLARVMEGMERYLIPCEYLVPDPAYMFMDAKQQCINFICDFENIQSFHESLVSCGEYVLEHMNHQDKETMRLGYGLYRLAMEDTFDRDRLLKLLEREAPAQSVSAGSVSGGSEKAAALPGAGAGEIREKTVDSPSQQLRREALRTFFEEEEREIKKEKLPLPALAAVGVICMTVGLEAAVYIRNGQNISRQWLAAGGLLILMSVIFMIVTGMLAKLKKKRKEDKEKTEGRSKRKEKKSLMRKADQKNESRIKNERRKDKEISGHLYAKPEPESLPAPKILPSGTLSEPLSAPTEGATVALSNFGTFGMGQRQEPAALIREDGSRIPLKGNRLILGKNKRSADILLNSPTVSRLHACITNRNGEYFIEDLNSKNGTQVNGELLEPKTLCALKEKDVICLADQIFCFTNSQEIPPETRFARPDA